MPGIARRVVLAGALALPALPRRARAASPLPGPVTLILPYAAGGRIDEVIGLLAAEAAARLGKPIRVENKPGRRGVRAIAGLVAAPPDGRLIALLPAAAIRTALLENLPFDAARDTTPIIGLAGSAFGCIAKAGRFPGGWAGFLAEARERPGALSYGSAGQNSNGHLTMARLLLREGVQAVHVPFRGATHGVNALLAGDVDLMAGPAVIGEAVTAGEAVWMHVWTAQRLARWPDAPTLRELGYRLVVTAPFGIVGPPGMAGGIVAALHDAFLAALRSDAVRALMLRFDMAEDHRDSAAYAAFLAESTRMEEMLIGRLGLLP